MNARTSQNNGGSFRTHPHHTRRRVPKCLIREKCGAGFRRQPLNRECVLRSSECRWPRNTAIRLAVTSFNTSKLETCIRRRLALWAICTVCLQFSCLRTLDPGCTVAMRGHKPSAECQMFGPRHVKASWVLMGIFIASLLAGLERQVVQTLALSNIW